MRRQQKHANCHVSQFSQFHNINLNLTIADNLLAVYVYVSFRSKQPNRKAVLKALKALQENNIDVGQLVKRKGDDCQQAKSSEEE